MPANLEALGHLLSNPAAIDAEIRRREIERDRIARNAQIDADIQRRLASGEMFSRRAYSDGPRVDFPKKLQFLFQPSRYKVTKGGRGGTKSWSIARSLLIMAAESKKRIACFRETQKSLKESVHQLLEEQIIEMQMQHLFKVEKAAIYGPHGSEFVFAGLSDQTASSIKSFEGFDIAWVEEAAKVTKRSWTMLTPTIRRPGSEIWISYNPDLETDVTHVEYGINPPPNAIVVEVNYYDNPWFPEVLRIDMENMKAKDEKLYRHVWLGEPKSTADGAIFVEELKAADESGRICSVPYDRTKPVDVIYDLGFGDPTALGFVQGYGGMLNFIDFYSSASEDITHYVMVANQRGYVIRNHYLPHDSTNNITHRRLAGAADLRNSIPTLMQGLGCKVLLTPALLKPDQMSLARGRWPQVRIDREKCADLIQALRNYEWDRKPTTEPDGKPGQRKPIHNWASHPSDMFMNACISIDPNGKPDLPKPKPQAPRPASAWS